MSKYINADAYKKLIEREKAVCYPTDDEFEDGCKTGLGIAVEVIDEMPSADVVEVVRCKDCKYCDGDDNCDEPVRWCEKRKGEEFFVTDEFFCAVGERKETE